KEERLVEEGRVEGAEHDRLPGGVGDRPACGRVETVDLHTPRQAGGLTVDLVVEPVAPAADRLGDEHARSDGVGEVEEADPGRAQPEPGADGPQGDRAPDAESALPDLERVE